MNATTEPELILRGGMPAQVQIEDQVRELIDLGVLSPGEQLPTAREVAVELAVNPSLVERAYERLEWEGYVSSEDGSGTFVASRPASLVAAAGRHAKLQNLCRDFLSQTSQLGFDADEVLSMVRQYMQRTSS